MMMPRSRWIRPAIAGVAFTLLLACGSGGSGGSGSGSGSGANPGGGGVGAPIGQPNTKEALGSPINIPKITNSQGQFVNVVRTQLEQELRRLCGNGDLCVSIKVRQGDSDLLTACQFDTTDPPPGTKVQRGTTLYVVTGTLPCDQPT
jgi:hypothetical protein